MTKPHIGFPTRIFMGSVISCTRASACTLALPDERPQRPQGLPGLPAFRDGARRIAAMLQGVLVASWSAGATAAVLPAAPFASNRRRLARGALAGHRATSGLWKREGTTLLALQRHFIDPSVCRRFLCA